MKDIKELGQTRKGVKFIMWQEVMNNDLKVSAIPPTPPPPPPTSLSSWYTPLVLSHDLCTNET